MHWGVMTVHCQECNPSNEVFLSLFSAILLYICYLWSIVLSRAKLHSSEIT